MTIYIALLRFLRNACIVEFPDFPELTVTIPNPAAARTQASGILLRHIQEVRHRNGAPPPPTPAGKIMGRRRSHDAVPMLIRVPPLES
jgi:hypothetical protein